VLLRAVGEFLHFFVDLGFAEHLGGAHGACLVGGAGGDEGEGLWVAEQVA
jgi:hypothetical protein